MSRIKRLVRPETHSMNWKTAVTLIATTVAGFTLAANAAVIVETTKPVTPSEVAEPITTKIEADFAVHEEVKPKEKQKIVVPARIDFEKQGCKPEYPRVALRKELQGTTSLQAKVAPSGSIAEVKVLKSSGHDILDEAVKTQLLSPACKMISGTINGVPQETTTRVQYVWKMDGTSPTKKTTPALVEAQNIAAKIDFEVEGCKPSYPRASLRNDETGTTYLSAQVSENGTISDVNIIKSSGFRGLDNAIRTQLQAGQCKAQPALQNGKAVASNANYQYVWKLD